MGDLTPAPAVRASRPLPVAERRRLSKDAVTAVFLLGGQPTDRALHGWGYHPAYLQTYLADEDREREAPQ